MPYSDRHKIDISNLRDWYDGLLLADLMIHADGVFDKETKWKLTLYQMIMAKSNHHIAPTAYQFHLMGVPTDEILAVWSPDYVRLIDDPRRRATFAYIAVAGNLLTRITADIHTALCIHFIDRHVVTRIGVTTVNVANAVHDQPP
ncbi:MAG: hypothetical protein AAF824_20115 [Bacteroidota bacterium]